MKKEAQQSGQPEIFLLGAGFSIPAGYPSHAGLTELVVTQAYKENTWSVDGPLTGSESPCQVAGLSRGPYLLEAVFLKRVFDCLEKPVAFEFFQKTLELFLYPGGRIGFTRMPCEEMYQWMGLIGNGRLSRNAVETIIEDAISRVFLEVSGRTADLTYVERFVNYCSLKKAHVFSTNFDTLIEQICQRKGISLRVLGTWSAPLDPVEDEGFSLYKLHGSLDWSLEPKWNLDGDNEYPVLYEREYQGAGNQNIDLKTNHKLMRMNLILPHLRKLQELYREAKTLTAIGFSFNDPHVCSALFPFLHQDGYSLQCVTSGVFPPRLDCIFTPKQTKIRHEQCGAETFCCNRLCAPS